MLNNRNVDTLAFHATGETNPKKRMGDLKVPLGLVPTVLMAEVAGVLKHGADKYGIRNWRVEPIDAETYVHAMLRHLTAWADGEDIDPDSGKTHLAHIAASCALVMDAKEYGKFIDNRGRAETTKEDDSDRV